VTSSSPEFASERDPASRRLVHQRSIRVEAYARADGLWDVEATLVDTKAKDFRLATGVRTAGDPVHEMSLRVTVDTKLNVIDAAARTSRMPYPGHCDRIAPDYRKLIGLNLSRNFFLRARELLGGTSGCTHLTELAAVLPTATIQAFAGEVYQPSDRSSEPSGESSGKSSDNAAPDSVAQQRPFQLDRCHALRTDGPAVASFYPRWYTGAKPVPAAGKPS
jgi:Protein of unknown function (DUF2889)